MTHLIADQWWSDRVVYQIYPRSFADGNGDGVGDLAGIRERVDHLAWLGVGVVWFSPFFPSGGADSGYDIKDYRGVEARYGTLDEFDALIDDLHRHDIKVVIDQVYNHTSDEHPWFADSVAGGERRDWYIWRPARSGAEPGAPGAEPSELRSVFRGPAWTFHPDVGEYYLHLFHRKQPDLNWEVPEVRHAVYDTMRWWLDRGVDGFRLDVINLISKPDDFMAPGRRNPIATVAHGPRLAEFLQEMRREIDAGRSARTLLIGETPGVSAVEGERLTSTETEALDMLFQFEHMDVDRAATKWIANVDGSVGRLSAVLDRWQTSLRSGWNSLYWSNHDQPRAVSRFGDDGEWRARSAKTLGTVLHLLRGTPFVYQGEEIAMANVPFSGLDEIEDVESTQFATEFLADGGSPDELLDAIRHSSRDNARTPMQWDGTPEGTWAGGGSPLAIHPDHVDWNVADQRDDPTSVLHHYRWLIDLRRTDRVVAHGEYEPLIVGDDQVIAFGRRLGDDRRVVVANLSGDPASFDATLIDGLTIEHADPERSDGTAGAGELEPWESRLYRS